MVNYRCWHLHPIDLAMWSLVVSHVSIEPDVDGVVMLVVVEPRALESPTPLIFQLNNHLKKIEVCKSKLK